MFSSRNNEQERLEANLKLLETQTTEEKQQLKDLQEQIVLLQEERELLQNQVWELLQQLGNLSQQPSAIKLLNPQEEAEAFPFAEFIETISTEGTETTENSSEELPKEWRDLLQSLPEYEIQVLKAVLEQDNPNSAIKKIAEDNITMPNLLIDSINERAQNTIGELIISTSDDIPEIYEEYQQNIQKILDASEEVKSKQPSSK